MMLYILLGVGMVFGSFLCYLLISMLVTKDCGVILIENDNSVESESGP